MAKDKNGREIKVGDFVRGRDGRSWKVKRIVGDNLEFELTTAGAFPSSGFELANSALNAKSIDQWAFDIMLRSKIGDMGKGAEEYIRKNRELITKDVGVEGFKKLCSKFGNALAYNSVASSNAVVRNALAWRARNALTPRYNPGDTVLYEQRSPAVHTTVDGFMPGFREKMKIRLITKKSGGLWYAKTNDGNKVIVDEADFMGKV